MLGTNRLFSRLVAAMHVHVNQQIFEKRPVLGLLLGAFTLVFILLIWGALYHEYKGFGKVPEQVDLKSIIPPRQDHGRWVHITQPLTLQCDRGIQELRDWEEQWLFGKVSDTYYLAHVNGSDRSVLLDYEGDSTCESMSHMEMTGVLEELTPRRREVLSGEGFLFTSNGVVMRLCLTCSPRQLRNLVLWSGFIPPACLYLIVHYGRKYRKQIEERKRA
jgi:hypothetical protein